METFAASEKKKETHKWLNENIMTRWDVIMKWDGQKQTKKTALWGGKLMARGINENLTPPETWLSHKHDVGR